MSIAPFRKPAAAVAAVSLFAVLLLSSLPLPARAQEQAAPQFVEREAQAGLQVTKQNIIPVILIGAAVIGAVFLLVVLVTKVKYDIAGSWQFHHDFQTPGYDDFDAVWTFIPYDEREPVMGRYRREVNGEVTQGTFTVVNKKDVVFQSEYVTEQFAGSFSSKTAMSGTFMLMNGASGNWSAEKISK